jgi:polysaccharide pyruvyl transferase WcaK-like protein
MIRHAALAYARDDTALLVPTCGVKSTSDMAFMLPYDKTLYQFDEGEKFGINVSSLLWDHETGKRFNLTVDYREFYKQLISYLLENTEYQVHLIPHVIDKNHYDAPENDCRICDELANMFSGKVFVAPAFDTPIEAKSYIANMDIFMGSRMHSTIGAISSGVMTIPFSYCHKFESLYSKIGYQYLISATRLTTDEALRQMMVWINNPDPIMRNGMEAVAKAKGNINEFVKDFKQTLQILNLLS